MRFLGILFTTLLIAAGAAQAQVAAPMLAPMTATTVGGFTESTLIPLSSNPAAMQWSDYSFVGIALADGEQTAQSAGAPDPGNNGDLEATFFQGRVVWEFFSVGVEVSDAEKKLVNPCCAFPAVEEVSQTNLALAFRIGDSVALGLGREANESLDSDLTATLVGISLRLGEVFFIGAALGTETIDDPNFASLDRDVRRFGIGLRTARNTLQWHLEVFQDSRDAFKLPFIVPGTFFQLFEHEATGLVVEMNWGGFLLGIRSLNRDLTNRDTAGNLDADWETEETTVTVGWVPESGFSIIGSLTSTESTESVTGSARELDTVSLGVGYVF